VGRRNKGLSLTSFNAGFHLVIHFAVPSHLNLTPLLTT